MFVKRSRVLVVLFLLMAGVFSQSLFSHCQVPCGIYDDQMRIKMIAEHITTMEKAMNQIQKLSAEGKVNYNQIVRWVFNKEKHAEELSQIVTYYFLSQRIKPVKDKSQEAVYQKKLTLLHHLLIYTMKAKQTADLGHIKKLRSLLHEFNHLYFAKK